MKILLMLLLVLPAGRNYYKVDIATFAKSGSKWTHVQVTAVVEEVLHEKDGDTHIVLVPKLHDKNFAVAECIPELKCQAPKKGQSVTIQGISRYDNVHKWWELHPVENLKVIK